MSVSAASPPAPPGFAERVKGWRRRLIAKPGFQRWAASFPLTRPIAEKNARALFDLCAGFVYSQTLAACVRLDVFARLEAGPRTAAEIAAEIHLTPEAAERLLRAGVALKLFERTGGRYGLADLGAAMIGNPAIAAFVAHHGLLYDDLRDPVALLRGEVETRLSRFWPYAASRPGEAPPLVGDAQVYARYSELMARSQALIAEDVLDAFSPRGVSRWLDVGGGEGAFAAALARRAPQLKVTLFDLPDVAARANAALAAQGLAGRVQARGGDFLRDALPEGAEVVSLVRVLHDHDDESALLLLRRTHAALSEGGRLLIAEPMAGVAGAEPIGDAYFGFYLLAMGRGRARTAAEIGALARDAGFARVTPLRTRRPLLTNAVVALRV